MNQSFAKVLLYHKYGNISIAVSFVQHEYAQVTAAGLEPISDFAPVSSKEFLDIQAPIECGFPLKSRLCGFLNLKLV